MDGLPEPNSSVKSHMKPRRFLPVMMSHAGFEFFGPNLWFSYESKMEFANKSLNSPKTGKLL